jgi:hypothetical protein
MSPKTEKTKRNLISDGKKKDGATASFTKSKVFDDVPEYNWILGHSASTEGMIATFYDKSQSNLPDKDLPLDNISWEIFTDEAGDKYSVNPLISSGRGANGKTMIDDYWIEYEQDMPDPYTGSGTTQTNSNAVPKKKRSLPK